jgi:hypothetical protein
MAASSSADQVQLECGQTEIPAEDGQGQRQTDYLGVRKMLLSGPSRGRNKLRCDRVKEDISPTQPRKKTVA